MFFEDDIENINLILLLLEKILLFWRNFRKIIKHDKVYLFTEYESEMEIQ